MGGEDRDGTSCFFLPTVSEGSSQALKAEPGSGDVGGIVEEKLRSSRKPRLLVRSLCYYIKSYLMSPHVLCPVRIL